MLEQATEQVAVAEAAVPVLGKGGMVGDGALEPEPAEPATSKIEMDLGAEPALRLDREA